MSFGRLTFNDRLGVSNVAQKNALDFATTVLKLPPTIPVYQQQLVHSTANRLGPALASADRCTPTPDNTLGLSNVMRQVSAHDFKYGRRNIKDSPHYRFNDYIGDYSDQLFYVCNEPEAYGPLGTSLCDQGNWNPPAWVIDSEVAGCYQSEPFWQTNSYGETRIHPKALARTFLMVKNRAENLFNRYHAVLPPAPAGPLFGADTNPEYGLYWKAFFDYVLKSGTGGSGSCYQYPVPALERLWALHAHQYHYAVPGDPLRTVAYAATLIRKGANWFRDNYTGGQSIPIDYILSETGPDHKIHDRDPQLLGPVWTGEFPDVKQALSYWNSWLGWVTRTAPYELGLEKSVMYACAFHPASAPYVAHEAMQTPRTTRSQKYFNLDAWEPEWNYQSPVWAPNVGSDSSLYTNSFPRYTPIQWNGLTWYMAPFGACYHVWSKVGADPVTTTFGSGWFYEDGQQGVKGRFRITFDFDASINQWCTIYIPFIMDVGTYGSEFHMRWYNSNGSYRDFGYLNLRELPGGGTYVENGITQTVKSRMILPLLVKKATSGPVNFEIQVSRTNSGPRVHIGRPIILKNIACTWSMWS